VDWLLGQSEYTFQAHAPAKETRKQASKPAEGMMLQVDGSPHDWLEGRGPSLCLIGAIDDATGKVVGALFVEAESSWGYFRLFSEIFKKYGLPQSVYADRHSIFWTDREPTLEEPVKEPTSDHRGGQRSPRARGNPHPSRFASGQGQNRAGTFQDRLVSELRRAGAKKPIPGASRARAAPPRAQPQILQTSCPIRARLEKNQFHPDRKSPVL
jgi:hypothetical protein